MQQRRENNPVQLGNWSFKCQSREEGMIAPMIPRMKNGIGKL